MSAKSLKKKVKHSELLDCSQDQKLDNQNIGYYNMYFIKFFLQVIKLSA